MSPKPQLIQQANDETKVTVVIAIEGVFGNAAILRSALFTRGASARAEPHTSTNAICIENARRLHTPPPQFSTTSRVDCPVETIAATAATTVRIIANTKGSGRYFLINFTDKSISFPIINFIRPVLYARHRIQGAKLQKKRGRWPLHSNIVV